MYTQETIKKISPSDNVLNNETSNFLVSVDELLSVKLKPVIDIIPSPARNMPHVSKFQLHMLNKAQLKAILNVKLNHINKDIYTKPKVYYPRHPVLKELMMKSVLI